MPQDSMMPHYYYSYNNWTSDTSDGGSWYNSETDNSSYYHDTSERFANLNQRMRERFIREFEELVYDIQMDCSQSLYNQRRFSLTGDNAVHYLTTIIETYLNRTNVVGNSKNSELSLFLLGFSIKENRSKGIGYYNLNYINCNPEYSRIEVQIDGRMGDLIHCMRFEITYPLY